jgi:hypothetical protein
MRKYREFTADYPTETDAISGNTKFESILTTIDLYSIVSFNPGSYGNQTTVRLSDNSMFDLRIPYKDFKRIMKTEVPELFHSAN